jgi:hypothetical protein
MKLSFASILLVMMFAGLAFAQQGKNPLVGHWVCRDDGTKVEIKGDGTLTINDAYYVYKVKGSVINVMNEEGGMSIPFQLDGDTLTVDIEGREMVYSRVKPGSKAAGTRASQGSGAGNLAVMQALVGKWCYMSNLTGTNSRMSNRCFILNADQTYEYSSETSSSGAYGGTASQEYDAGRWSATRTTITAISNSRGSTTYPIELRNHPKTGDAMIVLDGDAYVTAYQRRPW